MGVFLCRVFCHDVIGVMESADAVGRTLTSGFLRVLEFWKSSGILERHFPDLESSGILSGVLESSGKLDEDQIYLILLYFLSTYM